MERKEIYPEIWDEAEQDLKEEYIGYFHELKQLVAAAAGNSQGIVVTIA